MCAVCEDCCLWVAEMGTAPASVFYRGWPPWGVMRARYVRYLRGVLLVGGREDTIIRNLQGLAAMLSHEGELCALFARVAACG